MNTAKVAAKILTASLTLSSCGAADALKSSLTGGTTIKDSSNNVIARVLSVGFNNANVYVPSVDRFITVTLSSGEYADTVIYYSSTGCSGTAAGFPIGNVDKGVLFGNSKYYLATGTTTSFAYQSLWTNGACTNSSSNTGSTTIGALTEISRPYDFTSLAPISLSFE